MAINICIMKKIKLSFLMALIPCLRWTIKCLCIYCRWGVQLFDADNKFLRGANTWRLCRGARPSTSLLTVTWMNFSQIDAFGCFIQCYTSTFFFFPESRISQATCIYMENKQVYIFGQENAYEELFKNTRMPPSIRCTILLLPYLTSCLWCATQVNIQSGKLSNYLWICSMLYFSKQTNFLNWILGCIL